MRKIIGTVLLLMVLSGSNSAQIFVEVKDSLTGKPIANALVSSEGEQTFTDQQGKFLLSLFGENSVLKISHLAYYLKEVSVKDLLQKPFVFLLPRELKTKEVKIIGNKGLAEDVNLKTLVNIDVSEEGSFSTIGDFLKKGTLLFVKDYGSLQTVSFRGMSAENTLVLFNEARVNDLRTGTFNFADISAGSLGKIEYVKNSTSGFLTAGGVVKIYSGNETAKDFAVFGVGYNSNAAQNYFASVKKSSGSFSFSLNVRRAFSSNEYGYLFEGKEYSRKNAFFSKSFANAQLEWRSRKFVLKFYSHYSHLLSGLPGFVVTNNQASSKSSSLSNSFLNIFNLFVKLSRNSSLKTTASFNFQDLKINDPAGELFYLKKEQLSRFKSFSLLNNYTIALGTSAEISIGHYFGYSVVNDLASAFSNVEEKLPAYRNENILLGTVTRKLKFKKVLKEVIFSIGVNYVCLSEKIKARKNYSYWANALSLLVRPQGVLGWEFLFSVKDNYRHPTFNERFYSGLFAEKELQGEKYNSFEVTVRKDFSLLGGGNFGITYFNIFGENKIVWVPTRLALQVPRNVARVESQGFEASLKKYFFGKHLSFDLKYAFTKAKNITPKRRGDNSYGKQLIYVPLHKLLFTTEFHLDNIRLATSIVFVGKRYFTSDNTEENSLQPYLLTDLTFSYDFKLLNFNNLITLNVYNLFNQNYLVIQSYPMPLRTISINYQMRLK